MAEIIAWREVRDRDTEIQKAEMREDKREH
jgi:hypothetical protein